MSHDPSQVPITPLPYHAPYQSRRPGLITAIGVMSIIVAGLGMLVNLSFAAQAAGMILLSRVTAPYTATSSLTVVASSNWPDAARTIVLDALNELRPLTPTRRENLDLLLSEHGDQLFPFRAENATTQLVKSSVTQHGLAGDGGDYFLLANGRLDVTEESALFSPWEGGRALEAPMAPSAAASATGPAATAPTTAAAGARVNPFGNFNTTAAVLALIEAVAGEALAIYLLVCGILMLRNSPRGARLHWIYVWLKLPLALLGALIWAWFFSSMFGDLAGGVPNAPNMALIGVLYGIGFGVLALAYPVALLFALNARSVREFYAIGKG